MGIVGRTGVLVVADGRSFRASLRRILAANDNESVTVTVRPNTDQLRRDLSNLPDADIGADFSDAISDARTANTQIQTILSDTDVTVDIDVDTAGAEAQIDRVTRDRTVRVNVDTDRNRVDIGDGGASGAIGSVAGALSGPLRAIGVIASLVTTLANGIAEASSAIAGFAGAGGRAFQALQSTLAGIASGFADAAANGGKMANSLGQVVGGAEAATGPIGLIVAALVAIGIAATSVVSLALGFVLVAGAAIQLTAALAGLVAILGTIATIIAQGAILTLPAVFIALGLAVGGVVAIMRGFTDAVNGSDEALNDLGSNARGVALFFRELKADLEDIAGVAQEAFFGKIADDVDDLTQLLTPLRNALRDVASGLGSIAEGVIDGLASDEFTQGLEAIGEALRGGFEALEEPVQRLIQAFGTLAEAAAPLLEGMLVWIGELIDGFATWVEQMEETGELAGIFTVFQETLAAIWEIVIGLGEAFFNLFGNTVDDSQTFLENITAAVDKFVEWSETPEAAELMNTIAEKANEFMTFIFDAIGAFTEWVTSEEGQAFLNEIVDLSRQLWTWITRMVATFVSWATSEDGRDMLRALVSAVGPFIVACYVILGVWLQILSTIAAAIDEIQDFNSERGSFVEPEDDPDKNADGGIIRRRTLSWVGEAGPEVIIPLTRPNRARQLAEASGLTGILGSRTPSGSPPASGASIVVNVTTRASDPRIIANQIERQLARALGG